MKERSASLIILLSGFVALVLLIGWSLVGTALGGTGAGHADNPYDHGAPGPKPNPYPDSPPPDEPGPKPRPRPETEDSDGDFIPDEDEPDYKTDIYDWDSDNDHLSDGNEDEVTDPNVVDTDNDGI